MAERMKVDICVIGAGSGGLSVAAGASQMGSSVALIEKGRMGGDCLNFGCVPSKALLAAGHAAQAMRSSAAFGIAAAVPEVNGQAVLDHVQRVIAAIEPNDSVERFEGLGVHVIQAAARFTGPRQVTAGDIVINARRVVIATGSSPFVPPIHGLDGVAYLTNETIFDGPDLPQHLIVIGGGPIGVELAQAHRHLGCDVTVIEMATLLGKDDGELADVVRQSLKSEGVRLEEESEVVSVGKDGDKVVVNFRQGEAESRVTGSHLLMAVGRRPQLGELGLEVAGIKYGPTGIEVDDRLRTSNRKVFAIGDVTGRQQFTHVAGYHAGIVVRNALFRLPAKVDERAIPRVTYTDPELAQVGLTETEAKAQGVEFRVLRWAYAENDRAQAEHLTDGLIKVLVTPRGHILGAGIVGARAGEIIQTWGLAMQEKMKIGAIASMIAPYPTFGEVSKRAAGSFYTPTLFSERTRRIVRFLARFG
jgi:pyruvate/2-oxoglutarate dehydrogenase complex dihydrolipoamide dehydrogenase (E3) component